MCKTVLHQDNKAAILLQENGVLSREKKSRHVDIKYFFIKDRIEKGDIEIEFCGTDDMIADYMTKPLQGQLFCKFREAIMGMR
jgi:hypothetical protein